MPPKTSSTTRTASVRGTALSLSQRRTPSTTAVKRTPSTVTPTASKALASKPASIIASSKSIKGQPISSNKKTSTISKNSTTSTSRITPCYYDRTLPYTPHISKNIPIMFTAPHGLELYRYKRVAGGATKRILHRREIHTTELALRISQRVGEILYHDMWLRSGMKKIEEINEKNKNPKSSSTNDATATTTSTKNNDVDVQENDAKKYVPTCSFCVWNCVTAKPLDPQNADPNYTFLNQFEKSPWNAALREFKKSCDQMKTISTKILLQGKDDDDDETEKKAHKPVKIVPLHIDLHGKINRKTNFDLDVGLDSYLHFQGKTHPEICLKLKRSCREGFTSAVSFCPVKLKGDPVSDDEDSSSSSDDDSTSTSDDRNNNTKNKNKNQFTMMPATVEIEPWLSGLWSDRVTNDVPFTMTTQASLQDIPSFQLEIPRSMREAMVRSDTESMEFFEAFCQTFVKIFLSIQEVPPILVLEAMFSGVGDSGDDNSRKLVHQMLNECAMFLETEKPQI